MSYSPNARRAIRNSAYRTNPVDWPIRRPRIQNNTNVPTFHRIARGRGSTRQLSSSHLNQSQTASSIFQQPTNSPFGNVSPNMAGGSLQEQNGQFQSSAPDNTNDQANTSSGMTGFVTDKTQAQGAAPPSSAFNFSVAGTAPISNPFAAATSSTFDATSSDQMDESNFVGFNGSIFYVPHSTPDEGAKLRAARKANAQNPNRWSRVGNVPFIELTEEEKEEMRSQEFKRLREVDKESGHLPPVWAPHSPFHTPDTASSFMNGSTPTIDALTGTTSGPSQPSFNAFNAGTEHPQSTSNMFGSQENSQQSLPTFNLFGQDASQQSLPPGNPFGQISSQPQSSGSVFSRTAPTIESHIAPTPFGRAIDQQRESQSSSNIFGQSMTQSQPAFSLFGQSQSQSPQTMNSLFNPQTSQQQPSTPLFTSTTNQQQPSLHTTSFTSEKSQTPTLSTFSGFNNFQPSKPTSNLFGNVNTPQGLVSQPSSQISPQDSVMLSPPEDSVTSGSSELQTHNIFGAVSQSHNDASAGTQNPFTGTKQAKWKSVPTCYQPYMTDTDTISSRVNQDVVSTSAGSDQSKLIEARNESSHNNTVTNLNSVNEHAAKPATSENFQNNGNSANNTNPGESAKTPLKLSQTIPNSSSLFSIANTASREPSQAIASSAIMSRPDATGSGSTPSQAMIQSSRSSDQLMTLMPPKTPDHFTEEQKSQFVVGYRLRSLDIGFQKRMQCSKSFSVDSEAMQFHEMMKQNILNAGAGLLMDVPFSAELGPPAFKPQILNENKKRPADEDISKEDANGTVDKGKKTRVDAEISYPTLPSQGSQTSKLFASIANGSPGASSSSGSFTAKDGVVKMATTFDASSSKASSPTKPSTASVQKLGSVNGGSPKKPMLFTSGTAAPNLSKPSNTSAQGASSAFKAANEGKTTRPPPSSPFTVSGSVSGNNTASKTPGIPKFGVQTSDVKASKATSSTTNPPAFKVPNFSTNQNIASPFSGAPVATPQTLAGKAAESKSQPAFKVPMFGSSNTNSSGSAGAPANFLAQFGKKAEEDAKKEKAKRKAEDFDSEEDDEAEWERKDEEAQRAKKQKLAEQLANPTKAKHFTFIPSANSDSTSQASNHFMSQFGKKAEEDAKKEKAKRKAEDFDSDEDDEAEWERKDEEAQRLKKQKLTQQIAESTKNKKWSFKPSGASTSDQTKSSSQAGSSPTSKTAPKPSSSLNSTPLSSVHPAPTSLGKSIFSALNVPNSQNTLRTDNIFGKYSNPASDAEGSKTGEADNEESDVSDEDDGTNPLQYASTKISTPASLSNPRSFSSASTSNKNTSNENVAKKDDKPAVRSLFERIEHDEDGVAKRDVPATEEKQISNSFADNQSPNGSPVFGQISLKGRGTPFTQSLVGEANTKPKTGNLFAIPSPGAANPTSDKAVSPPQSRFTSFNSSTTAIGDHTWKPESPIRFGSTSATPRLNFIAASPSKQATAEQKNNTTSPYSGLFGSPKSGTDKLPIKPPSVLFGSAPPKPSGGIVGFGFGGPPKPNTGSLLAAPTGVNSNASSRATSPGMTTGGESANESTAEGSEDLMEHHEQINLATGGPGETDENIIFQAKAKAQEFDVNKKEWATRGIGFLRVLKHRETSKTRILMRQDPSGKIVLNTALMDAMKYEHTGEKRVKFGAATSTGKLTNWIIQLGEKEDALKLAVVLEKNKTG